MCGTQTMYIYIYMSIYIHTSTYFLLPALNLASTAMYGVFAFSEGRNPGGFQNTTSTSFMPSCVRTCPDQDSPWPHFPLIGAIDLLLSARTKTERGII